eukprot:3074492-Prymnesium_polylepis.1
MLCAVLQDRSAETARSARVCTDLASARSAPDLHTFCTHCTSLSVGGGERCGGRRVSRQCEPQPRRVAGQCLPTRAPAAHLIVGR